MVRNIKIHGIKETFNDYKKVGMYVAFPQCSLNCKNCQNAHLREVEPLEVSLDYLVKIILDNDLIDSVILSGMNPMDSFDDVMSLIREVRNKSNIEIIIYTGMRESNLTNEIKKLKEFNNVIIKFGEYIPNSKEKFDEVLGINLASDNQYAKRIEYL